MALEGIQEIEFSPKETYISTLVRYVKPTGNEPHLNLTVWETSSGKSLLSFTQKSSAEGWNVKWTDDESQCARLVSGEVQFFDPNSGNVVGRLKVDGIQSYSLSPGKRPIVAVFLSEKKGAPASVRLFDVSNVSADHPLTSKSFYKADSVTFKWNAIGTNVLIFTHTDVDTTGQNYYGETNLYYLSISGNYDCRVELSKPGPIHDVAWSPNSKEFIVVYGTMPSKATVFDNRASPMFDLGLAPRNTVQYNVHGRLFFLGGFGNLAGDVDIWDRKGFKKIASMSASNSSFCDWSPDGRYLLTGTLYRRLKVDNGIKIWHHSGALMHQSSTKELYQSSWRPDSSDKWPERSSLSPAPSSGSVLVAPVTKPVERYRPPGARGTAVKSLYDRDAIDNQIIAKKERGPSSGIPGMTKKSGKNDKKDKNGSDKSSPAQSPVPVNHTGAIAGGAFESEKKLKGLSKKLKQIQDLKSRKESGETLELTQLLKIESEAEVTKEFEALSLSLA